MKIDRVLIIGTGSISNRHVKNLKELLPKAKFKIVSSRGLEYIDLNNENLLLQESMDFRPDIAIICSPANYHLTIAKKLAEAQIHIFIEKPLSGTIDGIDEFIDIVDKNNIKIMVGYNLRFSESLLEFKSLLDNQCLGRALTASTEVGQYLPSWRPEVNYRNTVSAQSALGGGALLELSHELDYLIWIFGNPICVSSKSYQVSSLDIDVEDLVLARVDFKREGINLPVSIQLDFLQQKPYRKCKVICEKGALVWDAIEDTVSVHSADGNNFIFQGDKNGNLTYIKEMKEFIDCIYFERPPLFNFKDAYKVLMLIQTMNQSSKLGKTINLK